MATQLDAYESVKLTALAFIKQYAEEHQFFTGGDVLHAYRAAGNPDPEGGWRNRWGALITQGARNGWYLKAGKVAPTTAQSHTASLAQWQSCRFKGVQSLVSTTIKQQLEDIRKKVVLREYDMMAGLWKAYELGVSDAPGNKKEKS